MTRYVLKLNLLGCGDGGAVTSATSVAGRDSMMVMQSALLTGVGMACCSRSSGWSARGVLLCTVVRISSLTG